MLIIQVIIFFLFILALAFFRDKIANSFHGISLLVFNSYVPGVIVYSILFLPGVLIHELSHLITAELLGIRTGRINVFPTEIKSGSIKMGYVESQQTDPLRELLIGSAPFFTGLAIIFSIISILIRTNYLINITWSNVLLLYFVFTIVNTMFVSKEDRRAWWFIPLIILSVISLVYAFQIHLNLVNLADLIKAYVFSLNKALTYCLILDLATFIVLQAIQKIVQKITHKRLTQ